MTACHKPLLFIDLALEIPIKLITSPDKGIIPTKAKNIEVIPKTKPVFAQ